MGVIPSAEQWTFGQMMEFFGPKIFFSIICGGIIGLERELKNKPAGIKTNILICLGSALYGGMSFMFASAFAATDHYGDAARLAAQVIPGVGFLGGGAIIQSRGTIQGLTTAATIWMMAAIGICIGIGHANLALVVSLSVVSVLFLTNIFEDRVLGRSLDFACEISILDPNGVVRDEIYQKMARNNLNLVDFDIQQKDGIAVLTLHYKGHRGDQKRFVLELWSSEGIQEVKQL